MAFSKIMINGTPLIDLTQDTVSTDSLMTSYTAHDAAGQAITGTAVAGSGGNVQLTQDQNGYIILGEGEEQKKWVRPEDWPDYDKLDISNEECMFFTYDSSQKTGVDFAAFIITCTNGYTIERGTLVNGVWTVETTTTKNSDNVFSEDLPTDRDYTVYKVYPTNSSNHITKISLALPAQYNEISISGSGSFNGLCGKQKCIERYGRLPYVTQFGWGWAYRYWTSENLIAETQLDLSSITGSMQNFFQNCYALQYVYIKNFSPTNMQSMFANCNSLCDAKIINCDTTNVTKMKNLFIGCYSLTQLDMSTWSWPTTSSLTDISSMFQNCYSLQNIIGSNSMNVSAVTTMSYIFSSCRNLKVLDIQDWDTGEMTNMSYAFNDCSSLKTLNLNKWNTQNNTNLSNTFRGCNSLQQLNIKNWDVGEVTSLESTFSGCRSLQNLDVSSWNTESVTTMAGTFKDCSKITVIDVSNWDVSLVTRTDNMFNGAVMLKGIDISEWDMSANNNATSMFNGCISIITPIKITKPSVKIYNGMFATCYFVDDFIFDVESIPPLDYTSAFSNNRFSNGQRIRFPAALVDAAKAATNWSTWASYIEAIQT